MLTTLLKSVVEQDNNPVVICDLQHTILYMNPTAIARYEKRGGSALIGQSLLDCHNENSRKRIHEVVAWFAADPAHNRILTGKNLKHNRDVYMIALRDEDGTLIGYYEKHEPRTPDPATPYAALEA